MTAVISVIIPYKRIKSIITGNGRKKYLGLLSVILMLAMLLLAGSCRRSPLSAQLTEINTISETDPNRAFDSLRAINPDTLSERDRNYYDFLTVKCQRKQYQPAESDSLILKVLDYTARHQQDGYYPEALYTAGLVYTDLGDQPTALDYYQNSLAIISEETSNTKLKSKILAQIGRILAQSQLYSEAVPYLTEALENLNELKDTLNLVLDYQLLATVYKNMDRVASADTLLHKALNMGRNLDASHNALTRLHLGINRAECKDYITACRYIRNNVDSVPLYYRNSALAYSAQIYRKAGKIDSAYMYADRLVHSPVETSKASGYEVLLSKEVLPLVPVDSIGKYYEQYAHLLAKYYDDNSNALFLQQVAMYNYRLHKQKHLESAEKARKFSRWTAILAMIILVIMCVGIWVYMRYKNKIQGLKESLALATTLKSEELKNQNESLSSSEIEYPIEEMEYNESNLIEEDSHHSIRSTKDIRQKLQQELHELCTLNPNPEIQYEILDSTIYQKLKGHIDTHTIIHNNLEWKELDLLVSSVSPDFKPKLQILAKGNLENWHYQTALLIKAGFTQSKIKILLGLSKSSIHYRLVKLSQVFFDVKLNPAETCTLIRLM